MLHKLTIERYLCFPKHQRWNLNAYLNIYSRKGIQQSSLIKEMVIQKNLKDLKSDSHVSENVCQIEIFLSLVRKITIICLFGV